MLIRSAQLIAVSVAAVAVGVSGCKKPAETSAGAGEGTTQGASPTAEIVVGAYLSMTGSTADFGIHTKRGIDLAVDEVNRAGGIRDRQVRVVVLDDQGKADEAGSAVTRLIDVNGAVAILGEVASSLSLVGGRICQRRGIPMVSPSSTNTQVTEVGDHVFRVCFIDPFQGFAMAKFARETLHFDRIAVFKDLRNDYSIGLADAFKTSFTSLGGQIVAEQSYNAGDTDFMAQLTTFKQADVQALYVPGYYGEVGVIARQARRLGITVPLLGGDGWDSPQLRTIGGADIVDSYYTNHFAPDSPSPRARTFLDAYQARFHELPTGLGALGYDAAAILFDAMRRAPEVTPAAINQALTATRGYEAVTGTITLDAHRNAVKPAVVLRVGAQGDQFVALVAAAAQN